MQIRKDGIRIPEPVRRLETYEHRLSHDLRWALNEADQYFGGSGAAHKTLREIARQLDQLGIPYAVAGGLSLFAHGYRRFTEVVDILVRRKDLKIIHDQLEGRGYLRPHPHSKNLRNTQEGVKIEFLIEGDFPGDGRQKPVSFPDPANVAHEITGIKFLELSTLIELKLASGMTGADRGKDLSDVQELIKILKIPSDYAEQLAPYVREKYLELWSKGRRRYVDLWRNKWLTAKAGSVDDMINSLRQAADLLEAMKADGVTLESNEGTGDDYARLVTTDPDIADKYGMVDESEFWEGDKGE